MVEKTTFYTVNEVQVSEEGLKSEIPMIYDTEEDAYEKYYQILSAAVKSALPYHAGNIVRDDGVMIEGKVYDRRVVPEPEPTPEEV